MNILIIDDEPAFRHYLASILIDVFKHHVNQVGSFHEAMKLSQKKLSSFDMAFIDMKMPMLDGFQAGLQLKQKVPSIVMIMLTAFPSVEKVIKALRDYKFDDFLVKEELEDVEEYAQLKNALHRGENLSATRKALSDEYKLSGVLRSQYLDVHSEFIGQSDSYKQIKVLIDRVAPTNTTVLISGETGTGKELVAREIHNQSLRRLKPFIPINCSAIPFGLLESELFGHKKGAFTGAVGNRAGYFKLAEGGTLFLDEIGDMPLELQAKLLRVLEEKQFFPVGSGKLSDAVKMDVRILSATHADLIQKTTKGEFRQDLFYRLNTMVLTIPPLQDRTDDIESLVDYFISQKSESTIIKGIMPDVLEMLKRWPWPGNVRELQNVIERATLFCDSEYLECSHFPPEVQKYGIEPLLPSVPRETHASNKESSGIEPAVEKQVESIQNGYETLWDTFEKNGFRLWVFDHLDDIKAQLRTLLNNARYVKKGHSGRLVVDADTDIEVCIKYVSAISQSIEKETVRFEFLTERSSSKEKDRSTMNDANQGRPILQRVSKGLPDTYLFNLLYPPARKNDLTNFSQQRIIRAAVLRYALNHASSSTLKSVFEQTMSFLIDQELAGMVNGLSSWGLEAMRAYLCGADHVFSGMARKLKSEQEMIKQEIRTVFPSFEHI